MAMKRMTADQSVFDSVNFCIPSPDGDVNIIINEESPGKIHSVFILVGKTGSGMRALTDALARMITFALNETPLANVIAELSSITSDKSRFTTGGVTVRSIPEAVFLALMKYNNMYPIRNPDNDTIIENRPAKWAQANLAD